MAICCPGDVFDRHYSSGGPGGYHELGDPMKEGFSELRETDRAREEAREEQERRAEHDREMRRQWNRGSIIIVLFTFGYCVWLTYNVFF